MGVKGLSTFILGNPNFLKPYKLHDSYVIIDGDNLKFSLYFNKINVLFEGDYSKYADCIRGYFSMFLRCSVKPIVVFDGGYDKSGRKLKTVLDRAIRRLSSVKRIIRSQNYTKQILPILAHNVFISVLNKLDIPFVVCDYEADDQITALANYYKCPVISNDSDFFIFDIHHGFILLNSIKRTTLDVNSNGKEYRYLNCSIYHVNRFISYFTVDKTMLPLFGTLLGNDYVESYEFDNFLTKIQLPKEEKLISLLFWLRNKSLTNAINQVMEYVNNGNQKYLKSVIENSVQSYSLHNCNLSHIINQRLSYSKYKFSFDSRLITPCGNSLPLNFIIKYHSGHYSPFFANIIVLHKIFLDPQIEDCEFSSSYTCARYIRRVIYGILIRHTVDGGICQNEKCLAPIEEYDRHEDIFDTELVQPIFDIEELNMLPNINELDHLKKEKAKLILMKVLGVNSDFTSDVPAEWQLFIMSVNYWLCNCVSYPSEAFLYAVILNLIYCGTIRYENTHQNAFNWQYKSNKLIHECSSVIDVLSKINQYELQPVATNFKKYLTKPLINQTNPLCLKFFYSYNELQSCVMYIVSFNKLLGGWVENSTIYKCLDGSLLYNLTKYISISSNSKLFVHQILDKVPSLSRLFTLLVLKICQNVPNHILNTLQ